MCGGDCSPSSTPRIGARVDFRLGNLLFLNPSTPSSALATHVRFRPNEDIPTDDADSLLVSIHVSGDLTKPVGESGLMQQFTISRSGIVTDGDDNFEMALSESVSLNVGNDGIIGRRVSVTQGGQVVADGIVGFNF